MNATPSQHRAESGSKRCQGNTTVGRLTAAVVIGLAILTAVSQPASARSWRTATAPTSSALGRVVTAPALPLAGARVSIPSARHAAFPGAVRLPDGRLLAIWREGSQHLSFDGDLWSSTSSDNGATWTTKTTSLVMAGFDLRDPSLAVIDGTVWLTFCTSQPGAYGNGVYVTHSTDGVDWATPTRVDPGFPRAGESGPMVQVGSRLLQMWYGHPQGESAGSVWAAWSTDGSTWRSERVLNGTHDGRDYEEPWSMVTASGVRVFTRWALTTQIGSVDYDGTAWGNAHPLWSGSGRPSCVANGARVLCVYRQADPTAVYRPALMRLSVNGGDTFGPAVTLDGTAPMFTYAAPVAFGAGWVVAYAMQTNITLSRMYARSVTVRR